MGQTRGLMQEAEGSWQDSSEEGERLAHVIFDAQLIGLIECIPRACIGLLSEYYHSHAKAPPPQLQSIDNFAAGRVGLDVPGSELRTTQRRAEITGSGRCRSRYRPLEQPYQVDG